MLWRGCVNFKNFYIFCSNYNFDLWTTFVLVLTIGGEGKREKQPSGISWSRNVDIKDPGVEFK